MYDILLELTDAKKQVKIDFTEDGQSKQISGQIDLLTSSYTVIEYDEDKFHLIYYSDMTAVSEWNGLDAPKQVILAGEEYSLTAQEIISNLETLVEASQVCTDQYNYLIEKGHLVDDSLAIPGFADAEVVLAEVDEWCSADTNKSYEWLNQLRLIYKN